MNPICISMPAATALQPPNSQWLAGVSVETPLATSIPTSPPSGSESVLGGGLREMEAVRGDGTAMAMAMAMATAVVRSW